MIKINKLIIAAIVAIGVMSVQSCNKIFTTPELKGTWKVSSEKTTGSSEATYVNNSDFPDETLVEKYVYSDEFDGTNEISNSTRTETKDGETSLVSIVTETIGTNTSEIIIAKRNYTDSVHVDTLSENDQVNRTLSSEYTFEKDGTFTAKRVSRREDVGVISDNEAFTTTATELIDGEIKFAGTWAYVGKNKDEDVVNNQRVSLWYKTASTMTTTVTTSRTVDNDPDDLTDYSQNSSTTEETEETQTFSQTSPAETWLLVSKSKGEMEVQFENSMYDTQSETISTTSSNPGISTIYVIDRSSESVGVRTLTK